MSRAIEGDANWRSSRAAIGRVLCICGRFLCVVAVVVDSRVRVRSWNIFYGLERNIR